MYILDDAVDKNEARKSRKKLRCVKTLSRNLASRKVIREKLHFRSKSNVLFFLFRFFRKRARSVVRTILVPFEQKPRVPVCVCLPPSGRLRTR